MTYKFDKRRPGETLEDYLIRHRAHPLYTPADERIGTTDEELRIRGAVLPEDDPIYTEGDGIGLTINGGAAHYHLIGPEPGTNLLKEEEGLVYVLNDADEWEFTPYAITYLYGDVDTVGPLTDEEAKKAFARLSGGKAWVP